MTPYYVNKKVAVALGAGLRSKRRAITSRDATLEKSFTYACASVTKQYNLAPSNER